MLSTLKIANADRLIIALDGMDVRRAKQLVEDLGESGIFYKIGLELFMSREYFTFLDWLDKKGKKIFADLKMFDIPQTVGASIASLSNTPTAFVTVHGNQDILASAVEHKKDMKILAVTALTSMDTNDIQDLGFKCGIDQLVFSRAKRALEVGCDGIVSSGLEVKQIRNSFANKLVAVTPGIRPVDNVLDDDQKRSVTAAQAFDNGADYIVVGRPITKTAKPVVVAQSIQQTIDGIFS